MTRVTEAPEVRRPGEALSDITEKLKKDLPPDAPAPRLTDVTEAAGLGAFGEIIDLTEEDWDTVIDICLKGIFFSVKHQAGENGTSSSGTTR